MQAKKALFNFIDPNIEYQIINGDCLTKLKDMDDGLFDLILTSPPYNVGKSYETRTSIRNYLKTQEKNS